MGKITELARELRKRSTKAEKILWQALRGRKFIGYKFLRQQPVIYEESQFVKHFFVADFYCFDLKMVIELDGGIHLEQKDYDAERDFIMSAMGIRVLRLENEVVEKNLPLALKIIGEFIVKN